MKNSSFNIYIDFGKSKMRVGAINKNNSTKNFFYESDYFTDYLSAEPEIEKIISNLEKNTNEYLENIDLMIDSPEIVSIGLSLSKNYDGSKLKKEDVQFLVQDAKQQILRNYPKQNILHIVIKSYKIDNKNYTFLPTEINCNLLSIDIIFICLPKKSIEFFKNFFFKFDISIKQIFCSSYAKSISYKKNFTSIKNISFIDMGFDKTSITHYDENEISFFHVIPIGGNHITKDLSKILNIDLVTAEKVKLYFDKDATLLAEKKLSLDLVQKIIFARIEEILELCIKSIKLNQNLNETYQFQFILMGDGSKILDNKFKEKIVFSKEIDLLEETTQDICEAALKLSERINKQEVVIVPKKQIKVGFFEKFFHFFR